MDKERAASVQNRQRDTLRVYTSSVAFYNLPEIDLPMGRCYCLACLIYPTFPGSHVGFAKLFSDRGVETAETASTSCSILHEHLGVLIALGSRGSVGVWRRVAEVVLK